MPHFKSKNMSLLWLSAALLILLGTLLVSILRGEGSNWDWGMSQLTSPLKTGEKGGEWMEGAGRGVWRMMPALSGFLLGSEQLNSRDIPWFSKSINMCSAFNKIITPHFTKWWTSSLRLSIPGLFLVPKPHYKTVKRSIFDPHPGSCPRTLETLGIYCLTLSTEVSEVSELR